MSDETKNSKIEFGSTPPSMSQVFKTGTNNIIPIQMVQPCNVPPTMEPVMNLGNRGLVPPAMQPSPNSGTVPISPNTNTGSGDSTPNGSTSSSSDANE